MRLLVTLLNMFRGLGSTDSLLERLIHKANSLHVQALPVARLTTTYSRRGRIRTMPHNYILQSRSESKRIVDTIDNLRRDQQAVRGEITTIFGSDLERVLSLLNQHPCVDTLENLIWRYELVPQFQSERRAMMAIPRSDEVSRRTETIEHRRALFEMLTSLEDTVEQLVSAAGSIDFMLGTLLRYAAGQSRRHKNISSDEAMIDCCKSAESLESDLRELVWIVSSTKSCARAASGDRSLDELYCTANRVSAEDLVQSIIEVEQHQFENAAVRALKEPD